jgi:GT2 family glycosyltransferase
MQVTAVIPNWNGMHYLPSLFESLDGQDFAELLVVDNGSTDGSAQWAEEHGARVLRFEKNRGFAAAVNAGVSAATGDAVAILNNDVRLHRDWLRHLKHAIESRYGVACGKIFSESAPSRLDAAFDAVSRAGTALRCGHGQADGPLWNTTRTVQFVPLTAALLRTDVFRSIGGLDELFESYLEDVDFGFRCASLGIRSVYVPEAMAWHVGSGTLGRWNSRTVRQISRNQVYLLSRHYPSDVLRAWWWRIIVGQVLWGAVAARNFRTLVWLFGKLEGLRYFNATRRAGWPGVAQLLTESESTIREVQARTETDLYWRLYFALTRS